ncbi:XRE family transcriptional regulator [Streptomyces triticagri]|uniref:XRE family transcriptional regulator n=1 Tax=Streptomyces triticagri TaxID=2293568 RepID=A0A372LZL5_9ACTN|nr:helix-turn-helix transcriptional regulator [Streptomyces triticagri]RFU84126.1 XRE family transcriptional regulator [Streptomyces triticagri]
MSQSSSLNAARLALGQRLRAERRETGITARELASRCDWHESKVSRIENGRAAPSPADIATWLAACGKEELTADLVALVQGIDSMYVEWRHMEKDGLRRAQDQALPLWELTSRFKAYSQCLIPGPLQTEAYTRAVLAGLRKRRDLTDDVEEAVQSRMERQKVLRDGSKQYAILLEEAVLHYRLGDRALMLGQLSRLIEAAGFTNVSLGIIPRTADRSGMWPVEDFWIFDDRQVNVENVSAYITIKQSGELAQYQDAFSRLQSLAVYGRDAFALIMTALPDT